MHFLFTIEHSYIDLSIKLHRTLRIFLNFNHVLTDKYPINININSLIIFSNFETELKHFFLFLFSFYIFETRTKKRGTIKLIFIQLNGDTKC